MSDEKVLSKFEWLVCQFDGIQIKGAKSKYTSMNGNMFSFIADDTIAVRLSKHDREKFLAKHPDSICIQYNTVMKDYVLVPKSIFTNNQKLKQLYSTSVENAQTLKPKPTTRKAAKKKSVKKKAARKHK